MNELTINFSNKRLCSLILPLIVEQFLAITVGLADSIMVASVGEAAVSAVSLVDSINTLVFYGFAALATGGAVVCGQFIGSRDLKKSQRIGRAAFGLHRPPGRRADRSFIYNKVFHPPRTLWQHRPGGYGSR